MILRIRLKATLALNILCYTNTGRTPIEHFKSYQAFLQFVFLSVRWKNACQIFARNDHKRNNIMVGTFTLYMTDEKKEEAYR